MDIENLIISKPITVRSFILGQLLEDNEKVTWYKNKTKKKNIFSSDCHLDFRVIAFCIFELLPFANLDIENLL